jgi:uncharacterized membrane protein YccC
MRKLMAEANHFLFVDAGAFRYSADHEPRTAARARGLRIQTMSLIERQDEKTAAPELSCIGAAVVHGTALAMASLISYELITGLLGRAYLISRDDELLGGMWSMVATVFVYRDSFERSVSAALSRMTATLLSFALCLAYLLIFPFHAWGVAMVIGIGAIILTLVGRPTDIITTAITTAVVLVVAGISPNHAWREPILRFVDTAVGVTVGIAAARLSLLISSDSLRRMAPDLRADNQQHGHNAN